MKLEIVIAGGGFAGAYCARVLSRELGRESINRVGLVAEENVMMFQPMMAEVAAATLSPLDVVNPLRQFCRGVNVLRGRIMEIDLEHRRLALVPGKFARTTFVEFEHLVLALGSVTDLSRVPGMTEHSLMLKSVGEALKLRAAVINRLEQANLETDRELQRKLLTVVVVGGGYSGVEMAGQLLDFFQSVRRFYHNIQRVPLRVVLAHNGPNLLPEVSASLGLYAEHKLRQRGMEILLNTRVTSITASRVFLDHRDPIDSATVVCTIGNAPNPVIVALCRRLGLETHKGRIVTKPTMQVTGQERLWAAGDCAAVPVGDQPSTPPTAQFAQRQGKLLGRNIARFLRGKKLQPFYHRNLGQLASIGRRIAVAEIMGMRFSGFIAWWLWRSIYLLKLPGLQRKLRVLVDWTMDLFFPRDVSVLVPPATERLQEMYLEGGDVVYQSGEPANSFYVVKEGRVDMFDGDKVVRTIRAGQHFGEHALLENGVWHLSAMAAEPTKLVCISRNAFETLHKASAAFRQVLAEEEAAEKAQSAG